MGSNSNKSPFYVSFPEIPSIDGAELYACMSGMRYKKDDLMFVKFPDGANVGGVFTKNSVVGEPINWCKGILYHGIARGLVVNSGYANVCVGDKGKITVDKTVAKAAEILSCKKSEIYVASTGIIGQPVKDDLLVGALGSKMEEANFERVCGAINTTDTFSKGHYIETTIGDQKVKIVGIIKGSGMVAPNMATMLGYIFTDAKISSKVVQQLIDECVDETYNSITVDSDTSTSDMVLAFATGKAGNKEVKDINNMDFQDFREQFFNMNLELSKLVVKDGEGISKFVTVKVNGAESEDSARVIGLSVANSPLFKTAIAGADANWGRVAMAVGKADENINPDKLSIAFGKQVAYENGVLNSQYSEEIADEYMKNSEIEVAVDVAVGDYSATVYTSDLTHGYISINADYRS